jgi:dipeptidyl aminopeptidase/acylaminoacyl peptidase
MTRRRVLLLTIAVLVAAGLSSAKTAADGLRVPTIDDLLTVKSPGGAQISPDGRWVAYTVTVTDFKQDAYVTQIWLADTTTGRTLQLTRGDKSSGNPQWSPDGAWLAFTSSRIADKNQIFVIHPDGGEAVQLTKVESAVGGYSWSKDGKSIAFTASDATPQAMKDRKEHLGDFEVVRKEYNHTHLWTLDVSEAMKSPVAGKQRTKNKDFSVGGFSWSPDDSLAAGSGQQPALVAGRAPDTLLFGYGQDGLLCQQLAAGHSPRGGRHAPVNHRRV